MGLFEVIFQLVTIRDLISFLLAGSCSMFCSWLEQPVAASFIPFLPLNPKHLCLVLTGYTLVNCESCLPVRLCTDPFGAVVSADDVSEDPHGGYYVEYDETADE